MKQGKPCCSPTPKDKSDDPIGRTAEYLEAAMNIEPARNEVKQALRASLAVIPGGIFEMGTRNSTFPGDLDSPRRKVKVSPYKISPTAVTNTEFARFVEATGYRTIAEQEGWSFVFKGLLGDDEKNWPESPIGLPWWCKVDGACWSMPEGPGSNWCQREQHPAVHIAWFDALAYTRWAGLRLPREAEWERAARGGLKRKKFPWGDQFKPEGQFGMNTFQGVFPRCDTGEDGWIGTAPVSAFKPNLFGLWNMTGNVWEWVKDFYGDRPKPGKLPQVDPSGPDSGHARIQRGGSYLCHPSYCDRYHVHSRTRNDPESSTGNIGFRVASDE